jgi:lysophospholipase L1-like esterase
MGMPTRDLAALYTGGADRGKFDTIQTNLATTYAARFYNTDAGLKAQSTHSGQDAIDDGHDVTPASQRAAGDDVHPNNAGHITIFNGLYAKGQALGYW